MGFSSIFKRQHEPAPVGEPADEVQRARTRARQRLIGAVVLLAIGIVGFPMVFETQPRPMPIDIPIEMPRKEGVPPLAAPPVRIPAPPTAPPADDMITESREDAVQSAPPADSSRASQPAAAGMPSTRTTPGKLASARPEATKVEPRTAAKPDSRPGVGDDGARARALLDGKAQPAAGAAPAGTATTVANATPTPGAPASGDANRFIVQVGAFADATAAQGTRQKIERLGMKTYTQVASTPAGSRIRVRVGPFPTRDEADKALAKARGAGLSAVVLSL